MTTLYPPGEPDTNDALQVARSHAYDSAIVWFFAEIRPNVFCLYDFQRNVVAVVDTWDEVLAYYRARPPYVPPAPRVRTKPTERPANVSGIDVSKLEFKL
jgi:hypothetical protein